MKPKFLAWLFFCALSLCALKNAKAQTTPPTLPAGVTVTTRPYTPPTPEELEQRKDLWRRALERVSNKEKVPLLFRLEILEPIPNTNYTSAGGAGTMRTLQRATHRFWEPVEGIQTFVRSVPDDKSQQHEIVSNWMSNLSQEKQELLLDKGVLVKDMDKKSQEAVLDLVSDPNLSFALLDNWSQARVFLRFVPAFQLPDPGQTLLFEAVQTNLPFSDKPETLAMDAQPLLPPSEAALLEFKNEIISLNDLVKRASEIYQKTYTVNEANGQKLFYVSGAWSQSALEKVLTSLQNPALPPQSQRNPSYTNLYQDLLQRHQETWGKQEIDVTWMGKNSTRGKKTALSKEVLPMKNFIREKVATVNEITEGKPGLSFLFNAIGYSPSTILTLRLSMVLYVAAPGVHPVPESKAFFDGKPVFAVQDNIGKVELSF